MQTKIGEKREIRYKPYNQDIVVHLPIRLEKVIKENVLVQVVNEVVERIDIGCRSQTQFFLKRPLLLKEKLKNRITNFFWKHY